MAGFTIPNAGDSAYQDQAEPDSIDFGIMLAGLSRTGVIGSGCAVTAGTGLAVSVAAGVVEIGGEVVVVAEQLDVALNTADGTYARFDLVTVDAAGVVQIVTGGAGAEPTFPAVPGSRVVLAAVMVPATETGVVAGQLVDKRVLLKTARARKVATSIAVDDTYAAVVVDSALSTRTVTLPLTTDVPGHVFLFIRSGANPVTINCSGSETFSDGATSKTLADNYAAIGMVAVGDGSYYITGERGTVT